jgi:acetyl-CoA acetyltransferase family protein
MTGQRVAIMGGMRTPFVKAGTFFRDLSQLDLSTHAVLGLAEVCQIDPAEIDELVWGRVLHDPHLSNLAREIIFRLGWPAAIRAHLVSNNCISGLHAITAIADAIRAGRSAVGIAGGADSLSSVPMFFGRDASAIFMAAGLARSTGDRLRALLRLRPHHLLPERLSAKEPSTGLSMGQHAEISAKEWQISRAEQDEIALRSHLRAAAATADGRLKAEIHPLRGLEHDTTVRGDATLERLSRLASVFDKTDDGTISAGNSSPLTDGAAAVLLMSEEHARATGREPLAFIRDVEYAAIDPADGLLMAPALAVPRLLRRTALKLTDMDIVEVHEAFAAQVACNLRAWQQGWKEEAIGAIDAERLNPLGSSIAVGHPFAATGARIVATAAKLLKEKGSGRALISVCTAGGMGVAAILER